jgi:hypothetical protein
LANVESGPQSLQERPEFCRFESDIQRSRDNPYSKAGVISNDELSQVLHMQSDAITFPKATRDQSIRKAFDFSGQSFVSPYFFVDDKSNVSSACFDTMVQSSCRRHSHFPFRAASKAAIRQSPRI